MLEIYKNYGQINFSGQSSSNIPTRDKPRREVQEVIFTEQQIFNSKPNRVRIRNPDISGTLDQQVLIRTFSRYASSDCTGTMLTQYIAITAAHCVTDRNSNKDVVVYPPEKNCGRLSSSAGIRACKVVEKLEGDICQADGHDIALVRLSRPMPGIKSLRLYFANVKTGQQTVMAGTGINFNHTCESQLSYQTVVDCSRVRCYGRQWYCTEGTFKETSGACTGDSGGPSWTFGSGLTGITAAATVDSENDPCTNGYSLFSNLNYYKSWIECNMGGPMKTCNSDLPNVRLAIEGSQPCPFFSRAPF